MHRPRHSRRATALGGVAAGLVVAALLATPAAAGPPADPVTTGPNAGRVMGAWGGYVDGEYIGAQANIGGGIVPGLPGIDAELGIGELHAKANSQGLGLDLDKLAWDEPVPAPQPGEFSRAAVSHFDFGALANTINPMLYKAEQRSLPQETDWEQSPGVPAGTEIPGIFSTGVWSGRAKANWEGSTPSAWGVLAPGQDAVIAQENSQMGQVDLFSLNDLVPIPGVPAGGLIAASGGDQTGTVGTVAKPDGSLAAYAEIDPTLIGIDVFGGAGNGGISFGAGGTIGSDGTWEQAPIPPGASTRIRAVADGTPGGANIDGGTFGSEPALPSFEILIAKDLVASIAPDAQDDCGTLQGRPDICRIALEPGVSLNVSLPSVANPILSGTVTFVDVEDQSERIDPAGTYAEARAGGVTADLTLSQPNPVPFMPRIVLGSIHGGIATPMFGVQVPTGGIYAADATATDGLTVDKAVKSADGSSQIDIGDKAVYTVKVTNDSGQDRTGVTVTDDLTGILDDATYDGDATATSSSGGSTGTVSYAAPKLTWTGDLAAGESVTLRYTVTVDKDAAAGADGHLKNTAVATQADLPDGTDSTDTEVGVPDPALGPIAPPWMVGLAAGLGGVLLLGRSRRRRTAGSAT
ncbi:DUF11 domain-containing protein [Aquihabitans sp. G128]|uniref:DUF7927 domain-containing protein n=1 Tax=Aquihabitans sp. G128 TaxID=2849779 RepID=UPI001C249935|nr:isopeptide-forming domain-containing fimbrial protein [Aquihabitans sp. G128]QXC59679.1 DUF11 domain-containing protein [Aquihabitans sp. G128]